MQNFELEYFEETFSDQLSTCPAKNFEIRITLKLRICQCGQTQLKRNIVRATAIFSNATGQSFQMIMSWPDFIFLTHFSAKSRDVTDIHLSKATT